MFSGKRLIQFLANKNAGFSKFRSTQVDTNAFSITGWSFSLWAASLTKSFEWQNDFLKSFEWQNDFLNSQELWKCSFKSEICWSETTWISPHWLCQPGLRKSSNLKLEWAHCHLHYQLMIGINDSVLMHNNYSHLSVCCTNLAWGSLVTWIWNEPTIDCTTTGWPLPKCQDYEN